MSLITKVAGGFYRDLSEDFEIESFRCMRVRHKAADCRACMEICPSDAIRITSAGGDVVVDWHKCVHCGKCLAVCKNGVFLLLKTDKDRLFGRQAGHTVLLACKNSPQAADAEHSMASLAYYGRKHMVKFLSAGVEQIVFLHGNCDDCGKQCRGQIEHEIDVVRRILSLCNRSAYISLSYEYSTDSGISGNTAAEKSTTEHLTSRREFFSFLKKRTIASVGSAIQYATEVEKRTVLVPECMSNELEDYIESLRLIGGDELLVLMQQEGLLNSVDVDGAKCRLCGVCSRICPSGVITAVNGIVKGLPKTVEIRINDFNCTGCELCIITCPCKAISHSSV